SYKNSNPLLNRSKVEANNVNALVDAVVAQLLERPEIRVLIDSPKIEKPIPIDEDGNFIDKVLITGLTSFGRTADAILTVLDDGTITLEAGMGVQKVHTSLEYRYKMKCCLPLTGTIGAELDWATFFMKIQIRGFTLSLVSLDVNFEDPKVESFSGTSAMFNWLAKLIVNKVIASRKEEIRQEIITVGSEKIAEILKNLDIFALIRNKDVPL
ncbi:hypothetical protein BIW11_07162, partial [Tropilaelaps mercedesae]